MMKNKNKLTNLVNGPSIGEILRRLFTFCSFCFKMLNTQQTQWRKFSWLPTFDFMKPSYNLY